MENIDFDKNEEKLIRDSERLRAVLAYVNSCEYGIDKKIIFAIAGVQILKEVQE